MSPWRGSRPDPSDARGGAGRDRGMESARRASSLPSGVFRTRSPDVEQAIAGGAGDVFLEHMRRIEGPLDVHHGPAPTAATQGPHDEEVPPDAIDELLTDLHVHADAPAPDLGEGLLAERTFVLVDLAVRGDTRARAAATAELLGLAEDADRLRRHCARDLRRLVTELDRLGVEQLSGPALEQLRQRAQFALGAAEAGA